MAWLLIKIEQSPNYPHDLSPYVNGIFMEKPEIPVREDDYKSTRWIVIEAELNKEFDLQELIWESAGICCP